MASVAVFATTRFTALAAGDVIPVVDISDVTQSAHGSLDSITVTNFFKLVPVPTTFGATALPAGLSGSFTTATILGVTPDLATNVARSSVVLMVNYGDSGMAGRFVSARASGTVTAPTATVAGVGMATFVGYGYDGTNWAIGGEFDVSPLETWTPSAHGTVAKIQVCPVGSTAEAQALAVTVASSFTQIYGASSGINFRNAANAVTNLGITDAGIVTVPTTFYAGGSEVATAWASTDTSVAVRLGVVRAGAARIGLYSAHGGTLTTPTIIQTGDSLGTHDWYGVMTAAVVVNSATIGAVATENWVNATSAGTKLIFNITPNTTASTALGMTLGQDKSLTVVGAFGCNAATARTAAASGGALNAYGAGGNGLDSGANMSALHALVVAIRLALVNNGIMS